MKKSIIFLFAILMLFSGCVRLNTTQELKRNGLMNVLVIFDSSYFTISNSINSSIMPNPDLDSITERINNTLVYYFSNVNPFQSDLFININHSDYLKVNASGFLGGNTFKYNKVFKFPYYYYYYSANFGNASIEGHEVFNETYLLESIPDYDINYDIVYFGELVSTNGQELEKNKVRFSLNNISNYELTFREFFLTNWLARIIE
jgi:hypothetical protein